MPEKRGILFRQFINESNAAVFQNTFFVYVKLKICTFYKKMCSISLLKKRFDVFLHKNYNFMQLLQNFSTLINRLRSLETRKKVVLVCPNDSHTEYVINRGLKEGFVDFILVLGGTRAEFVDSLLSEYPDHVKVFETESPDEAAAFAVKLVHDGGADVLMKGTLNTDNLLRAVLNKEYGLLEKGHVMTHVTVAQIPSYEKLLVFSDAAVVPRPTEEQFKAILGYVLGVCRSLGESRPKVALIHCTEKVSEKFPHTLSYEEMKRMVREGAYGEADVDGPMDVKTACDSDSGAIKGISSPVVGHADALVFPNIESGNVFYKTITLFAEAQTAGMLCGTTAPIVVASRADSGESKFYSLALACLTDKMQ